ncbi:MAG: DUF3313 domain-containing protein [Motiliproteus sp.]
MKTTLYLALSALCVLLLSGCESQPVKGSGFLVSYEGFEQRPWSDGANVYLKPGTTLTDLNKYNKIMLTPIEIWQSDSSEYKGVDPQELAYIANSFTSKIKAAFEPDYPIVKEPGPDVLVFRMAITGLERKSPERSALGYIPIALLISAGGKAINSVQGEEAIIYHASLEAEGYDAVSGARMLALVDDRKSDDTEVKKGGSNIKILDETLDYWVGRFRRNWDKAHGKK